ncbi:MAG: polysaccharide biosynthesis tyrosine autokinase [Bacteroidales bacterium]|nr:polysaccharide biosynthesis tyrosine autokinase [Bacteroidales bacterium]
MENNIQNKEGINESSNINIAEILYKMLSKCHWFVISIIVAFIGAFIITKYSTPQYEAKATLLIKSNNEILNSMDMAGSFMGGRGMVNFQNEIGTIQSLAMVKRTVKALGFYTNYYQKVNFKNADIYKASPFEVTLDLYKTQAIGVVIDVKLKNNNSCVISYKAKNNVPIYDYAEDHVVVGENINIPEREITLKYGEWFEKDGMKFKIDLKDPEKWNSNYSKMDYAFVINDLDAVANQFRATNIELLKKESSIISIKYVHENKKKAEDFVNMLCKIYIDQTFEEKNYLHVATINFVNSQIENIADSLSLVESRKEAFQKVNNTLSLTNDAQYIYQRTNELEVKRAEAYTQNAYYDALEEYINKADLEEGVAVPTTMGIQDPILNNLVSTLTTLVLERQRLSTTLTPKSPKMKELSLQIETTRKQIQESLRTIKKHSEITQKELRRQQNLLQVEIDKLPTTQRNMINIERQFKFNDVIYSFLYQKRAEAEIAKNAALPDHKVVDKAQHAVKIYPRTSSNYLIALLIGLIVPGGYIFIRYITNNTINGKDDLEKISNAPILGYIPQIPDEYNKMIVLDKPKSQITEAFRSIRTNIKYILHDENATEGQVILVTSSLPNDGKSLFSMNLASVFSLSGKKTILVGYDLRKPKLHKVFHVDGTKGITSYLIGRNSYEEIIQHTEFDNLDVLVSGPVPPNPSELVDSDKNRDLIKQLRKQYDYIILDTPPVSLIADAQCLAKESDMNIFVVRSGQTDKGVLKISLAEMVERSNVKVNFVINGIENAMQKYGYGSRYGSRYGYGYGYGGYGYGKGYGYGYGYGYFDEDKEILQKGKAKKIKK